jgi:colanic acid biosynthesis protein WcaH
MCSSDEISKLAVEDFSRVIRCAPLVSIDLIVEDTFGRYLLGWRNNPPAKGCWFVPGGRIYKDEAISSAFSRISQSELGNSFVIEQGSFLGVYEHFYEDNAFSEAGYGTHYIALGFVLKEDLLDMLPEEQHNKYRWMTSEAILSDSGVHAYAKNYFLPGKGIL